MRPGNRIGQYSLAGGISDFITSIGEYVHIAPTEKTTTAAITKTDKFLKNLGIDTSAWMPKPADSGETKRRTITQTIQGVDPKVLWFVGGSAAILLLILMSKKRK